MSLGDEQLSFDLGDKFQKFERLARDMVRETKYSTGESVQIYSTHKPDVLYLGIRTSGPVETDHEYRHKIDFETAKYLIDTVPGVGDWFSRVRDRTISEGAKSG